METAGYNNFEAFVNDYDGCPVNGRWYFYGTERFCSLLDKYNYSLVSKDVAIDIDKLSPIVHFRKLKTTLGTKEQCQRYLQELRLRK